MITIGQGSEALATAGEKNLLSTMLAIPGDKEIEIGFSGKRRLHAPAAFPITIGDVLLVEAREESEK